MGYLRECRFCNIINGEYHYKGVDQPFLSNDAFCAIVSIGALIEGWSLIIPKEHQLSMRKLYNKTEFIKFVGSVIPKLVNHYGPLIAFEHGSNKEGSITGCGTDHAHLHLVPFRESLIPDLLNSNMQWVQCKLSEVLDNVGNREYLFYSELQTENFLPDSIGYLHVLERPISQFFRHLIALRLGCIELSNYRLFPHLEVAKQTRSTLVGVAT